MLEGGSKVFFVMKGDPGPVMTLARSADSALIGSFTYHRGEHQSLLAGFSLEPDALDKTVEEWQSIFNDCLPDLQILRTFGHPLDPDPLSQGSWCSYCPGTGARFAEALPLTEGKLSLHLEIMATAGEASWKVPSHRQWFTNSHGCSEMSERWLMQSAVKISLPPDQTQMDHCPE